jgi:hypothetical protein
MLRVYTSCFAGWLSRRCVGGRFVIMVAVLPWNAMWGGSYDGDGHCAGPRPPPQPATMAGGHSNSFGLALYKEAG